jgi:hypothetical protein
MDRPGPVIVPDERMEDQIIYVMTPNSPFTVGRISIKHAWDQAGRLLCGLSLLEIYLFIVESDQFH